MELIILLFPTTRAGASNGGRWMDLVEGVALSFNSISTAFALDSANVVFFLARGTVRFVHFEIIFVFLHFANLTHGHSDLYPPGEKNSVMPI